MSQFYRLLLLSTLQPPRGRSRRNPVVWLAWLICVAAVIALVIG